MSRDETITALSKVGPHYPPDVFVALYESVLSATTDPEILSRLMFTASMYLDQHPGVLRLPRATAEQFLASEDIDELMAGLKAIRHSTASTCEVIAHFVTVLKRNSREERNAALYQLGQIACDCDANFVRAIDPSVLSELHSLLSHIAVHDPEDHIRDLASRCTAATGRLSSNA